MINHIVMWNFIEELSQEERQEKGLEIKTMLEDLKDKIPGTIDVKVYINDFSSSNRDIMLFSSFESKEALESYQIHPDHVKAGTIVRPATCDRACFDYEV